MATSETAYEYEVFTPEERAQVLQGRIRQEENQHFVALMEAAMAEAAGDKAQAEALRGQADKHVKNIKTIKSLAS